MMAGVGSTTNQTLGLGLFTALTPSQVNGPSSPRRVRFSLPPTPPSAFPRQRATRSVTASRTGFRLVQDHEHGKCPCPSEREDKERILRI